MRRRPLLPLLLLALLRAHGLLAASGGIAAFWDNVSSDEEIFDKPNLKKSAPLDPIREEEPIHNIVQPSHPDLRNRSCNSLRSDYITPFDIEPEKSAQPDTVSKEEPIPSIVLPCQPDVRNSSPCSSLRSDNITPFDIEPLSSFDNSPSASLILNILRDDFNIPTPMPSPEHRSCGDNCSDEFCVEHDQHRTFNITPIPRKRFGTRKSTDNVKRKCVRNIARTFAQAQQRITPLSNMSPTTSITPLPSSDEENNKDPDFAVSDESDEENNNTDDTDEECMIPSPRGEKKQLRGRDEWLQNKRKRLKNSGQEYCTNRGKIMLKKEIKPVCDCRFKCYEKITEAERNSVFQKFWQLGDRQKQWTYLVKYVKKVPKNRCLNQDTPNNRKFTYKYNLPLVGRSDGPQVSTVDVCKTMFMNTLVISDRMIRTAWEKYDGSTEVEKDKRGCHKNHRIILNESMVQRVVDHVNALAPVESHHLRKKSKKLYLEGAPTISRMYQLYNEWFDPEKYDTKAITERQYREIVRDKFNLGRFIPKKDQCRVCHIFKNKKDPNEAEILAQEKHKENKGLARDKKEKDKKEAIQSNGKILAAVFDFEKVLVCPHAKVSLLYYKRKLACLNFTVFDMGTKKAVCYMWDETVAGRGSNEVSSCLLDYIDTHVQRGVEEFRFWSDNCTGQNRNRIVFFLYAYAASKYNVTISHTFLEVGHTQNEGDSVHSTIERASSLKTIYTPEEWKLLVRWARAADQEPYLVKNMSQDNFWDFKKQINDRLWLKNSQGEKIRWTSVRYVCVTKNEPFKLKFKYTLNENDQNVTVRNRTRRQIAPIVLAKAYNDGPLPLSSAKFNDLISLCKQGVIPDEHVSFYEQLPNKNAVGRSDPDPDPQFTDEYDSE